MPEQPCHMETLLLVDADSDCERLFFQAASRADYSVLLAKTSREAFEIIRDQIRRLDLIVVVKQWTDVKAGFRGIAEKLTAGKTHMLSPAD